jgi:predicted outer membrane protein
VLATWLLVENQNEIELAKIAQQRATHPEVKRFAEQMIQDHQQMAQKLQPIATAAGYTGAGANGLANAGTPGSDKSTGTDRNDKTGTGNPLGRTQEAAAGRNASGGEFDHIALVQDLGRQCLSTARTELEKKQGAEFDRCYMGMAVMAHAKVNDQMTVFPRYASSSFANVIADGQKTVAMHLEHAKDLCKQLESESKSTTAPRSGDKLPGDKQPNDKQPK